MENLDAVDRVAVTGATGFIGTNLVRTLVATGYRPILFARSPQQSSWTDDLEDRVRWVRLDLLDGEAVGRTLETERPTVLFHLAGTRGRGAGSAAVACAELNVSATVRLLAAARRTGVRRVVMAGSASEYGRQAGALHEGLTPGPVSAYGISKAAATSFARAMYAADGCPVVILRMFSVYGPGQPADMFVEDAVRCALTGVPFRMSHGEQRRDLVFVKDVVRALIAAMRAPGVEGNVINVGSGSAVRLRDVALRIWELSESKAALLMGAVPAEEDHDTWADISLARWLLAWGPETDLDSGLRWTIEWTRERLAARGKRFSTAS